MLHLLKKNIALANFVYPARNVGVAYAGKLAELNRAQRIIQRVDNVIIGAVVFSIIGILYLRNRGKGKLAASLIPQVRSKQEEELSSKDQ